MRTISTPTSSTLAPTSATTHSPWHSPIPYLFGGLAAMLGLIAFALLMLACSYWRLLGHHQSQDQERSREQNTAESLEKEGDDPQKKEPFKSYEEKILVIMAGDEKPTFLATPVFPNIYGKGCDESVGDRESFTDVSEKETMDKDNHDVLTTITITTPDATQGNEGSQQEQQNQ